MGRLHAVAKGEGRLDILCEHNAEYAADAVEEDGIVSMYATCGRGCADLTLVGTGVAVGAHRDG